MVEPKSPAASFWATHRLTSVFSGVRLLCLLMSFHPSLCLSGERKMVSTILSDWSAGVGLALSYNLGYDINDSDMPLFNQNKLGITWDQLLAEKYFVHLDIEGTYDYSSKNSDSDSSRELFNAASEIEEFYVQTNYGSLSIKAGKQVVVWGKADFAVVTDVISPRDFSGPLFSEDDISRMGQTMLTLNYYTESSQLSLTLNPDAKANRFPYLSSAGSGYAGNVLKSSNIDKRQPDASFSDMEVGVRWNATVGDWDYAVVAAEVFENNPAVTLLDTGQTEVVFSRFQMLGGGFNLKTDNLLWKGEVAYKKNRLFNSENFAEPTKHDTIDMAIGMDYNPSAYTLTVELANHYIDNWSDEVLGYERNNSLIFARVRKPLFHDTVFLQYTASYEFQSNTKIHQIKYIHDLNNQMSLGFQSKFSESEKEDEVMDFLNSGDIFSANFEVKF
ncbi:DUF1302 family protein [Sedimenticola sp.]|uniref:DUF1302 family protein n=1 Tax=Sedimenticola sp. TaxID=1940285 RepID=UPI003D0A1C49